MTCNSQAHGMQPVEQATTDDISTTHTLSLKTDTRQTVSRDAMRKPTSQSLKRKQLRLQPSPTHHNLNRSPIQRNAHTIRRNLQLARPHPQHTHTHSLSLSTHSQLTQRSTPTQPPPVTTTTTTTTTQLHRLSAASTPTQHVRTHMHTHTHRSTYTHKFSPIYCPTERPIPNLASCDG